MIAAAPIRFWLARVSRFIGSSFLRAARQLARAGRDRAPADAADPLTALRLRYPDAPTHWLEAVAERMQSQLDAAVPPAIDLVNRDAVRAAADTGSRASPEGIVGEPVARDKRGRRIEPGTAAVSPRVPQPSVFSWPARPVPKTRPVFVACQVPAKSPSAPSATPPDRKAVRRRRVVFESAPGRDVTRTNRSHDRLPMLHDQKPAARATRDAFTADVPTAKKTAPVPWNAQLPPAHVAQTPRTPLEPSPSRRREARDVAAPDARAVEAAPRTSSDKADPTPWLDGRETVAPGASIVAIAPALGSIQASPFTASYAGPGDRWPDLPPVDVSSEQARRVSELIEQRARIERLKSDQTERLWNE